MTRHLIVGAGGVGRATASALLALDPAHEVVLASRSGTGPGVDGAHRLAVDASDSAALSAAAEGFDVVYNCVNPPNYTRWEADWPPVAAALLAAGTGRTLVTMGNLYVFDATVRRMSEDTPMRPNGHKGRLRRDMTDTAMAAHEAGVLRYAEARASDFFGPGSTRANSYVASLVAPRARRGRTVWMLGADVDAPHTWTYVPDVGRTLAVLGTRPETTGRIWHVPSNAPRSVREVATDIARLSGVRTPAVRSVPWPLLSAAGVAVPFLRELRETHHQAAAPYELDSARSSRDLGLTATAWDDALRATLAALEADGDDAGAAQTTPSTTA